jgi:hypothetical protein
MNLFAILADKLPAMLALENGVVAEAGGATVVHGPSI